MLEFSACFALPGLSNNLPLAESRAVDGRFASMRAGSDARGGSCVDAGAA